MHARDVGVRQCRHVGVLYLAYDGADVTKGTADDPTTNTSRIIGASGTISAFLAGDANRAAKLDVITAEVRRALAPFDIDVVTSRPASGAYDMVLLGGRPTDVGLPASYFDIAPSDCNDVDASNVAFEFNYEDHLPITRLAQVYGQQAIAMLADMHGIPTTLLAGDCLCQHPYDTSLCGTQMPCTFHANVKTEAICGPAQMGVDTRQLMLAEFGAHP